MDRKKLAVMIPCYNEEQTVAAVLDEYRDALPDAWICVGDNASTDRTAKIAAAHPACDQVVSCKAKGKGAMMKAMIREVDADYYLFTDGDLTYPANAAPLIVRTAEKTGGMAVGRRELDATNQAFLHKPGNRLVDALIGLKYGRKVKDAMSGYRCVPRPLAKDYALLSRYDGFQVEVELTMFALARNEKISYIGCGYRDRPFGSQSKISTVKDGARIIWAVLSSPLKRPKKEK